MYMLIPKICSEHALFIFWRVPPTLAHIPFVCTVTKRIIISNYIYNKICDKHTVDTLFTFEYNSGPLILPQTVVTVHMTSDDHC
jgi:hypothetical protein